MEGAMGRDGVYVFTHYLSWLTLADVRVWWGSAAKMSVATVQRGWLYVVTYACR